MFVREGGVDNEIAIVGYNRTSFGFAHSQSCLLGTKELKVEEHFGKGERGDLDRHALLPLRMVLKCEFVNIYLGLDEHTFVPRSWEFLR